MRVAIVGVLAVAAACCGGCRSYAMEPDDVLLSDVEVTLPARFQDRMVVTLETFVNGSGPYTFLLDTGSEFTFVSEGIAQSCPRSHDLFAYLARPGNVGGVPIERACPVYCESIRVGGVEIRGMDCQVAAKEALSHGHEAPIDGILGYHVFAGGCLVVDFPRKEVSFGCASLGPVDGTTVFPLVQARRPDLELSIGTERFLVTLDTGSTIGVMLDRTPDSDALASPVAAAGSKKALGGDVGGFRRARIRGDVKLGAVVLVNPMVTIGSGVGVVGLGVLSRYRLVLDLARGTYALEGGPRRLGFAPVRGTGAILRQAEGRYVVGEVLSGSPADTQGLRRGDRVVSVNGVPPGSPEWDAQVQEYQRKKGAVLRFALLRGDTSLELEIPVVDLVP